MGLLVVSWEVSWKSFRMLRGGLLDVSWQSLGSLLGQVLKVDVNVPLRFLGGLLEFSWSSHVAWRCMMYCRGFMGVAWICDLTS